MVAGVGVRLLQVPYDSGVFAARMGAGPLALAGAGAARRLRGHGHMVREQVLAPSSEAGWRAELVTAFELHHVIANAVTAARAAAEVPLLLSGNCNATVGVLAGMSQPGRRLGLVWLDAHGDFNTPDVDTTGFLDGHALAMAVGRCWQGLTARIPGFTPLPERHVLLAGARSLDDAEHAALAVSEVTWLRPAQTRDADTVRAPLDDLAATVDAVHFHVDLDVHDPLIARPTATPPRTACPPTWSSSCCAALPTGSRSCRQPWPPMTLPSTRPGGCKTPPWTCSSCSPIWPPLSMLEQPHCRVVSGCFSLRLSGRCRREIRLVDSGHGHGVALGTLQIELQDDLRGDEGA